MKDEEALAAMASGDKAIQSDQLLLRRLLRLGWIECDDVTTLDSTDAQVLLFIAVTGKGQKMLEGYTRGPHPASS